MNAFGYTVSKLCQSEEWPFGPTKTYELINAGVLKAKKCRKSTIITPEAIKECIDNLPDYEARGGSHV